MPSTLPLSPSRVAQYNQGAVGPIIAPSPVFIKELHDASRIGQDILRRLNFAARAHSASQVCLLLMAIDPASGNSVLHTGVLASNIDILRAIQTLFRPLRGDKALYLLTTHKNLAGNTILHLAAQQGSKEMAIAVYRFFCYDYLGSDQRPGTIPAEEEGLEDAQLCDEDAIPRLLFLIEQNNNHYDASTVAGVAGHQDLAQWLGELVNRIDPKRNRMNSKEMARMELWLRWFWSLDEDHDEDDQLLSDQIMNEQMMARSFTTS